MHILIPFENKLIKDGLREPSDYIPTDKPKTRVLNFNVSEPEYKTLMTIGRFYDAPHVTGLVNHLLLSTVRLLDKKDGE